MDWVYLDNNATTQPDPRVVEAVVQMLQEYWANPSSVHRFGQMARQRVELARSAVAGLIGCRDRELVFTSGGTESNNLALRGVLAAPAGRLSASGGRRPGLLITTKIEHSAVREPAEALAEAGVDAVYLPTDPDGRIDPADLAAALDEHAHDRPATLVSVQWANNETGVIQPIAALAGAVSDFRERALSRRGVRASVLFHTDATQAVGKLAVDVGAVGVDLLTLAAHKFHGPKGVGGLYIRRGVRLRPQSLGGPQERDRRGGTENTPGIVGFGVAAELAGRFLDDTARVAALLGRRDRLEKGLCDAVPDAVVNSAGADRLWNTTNVGFPHLESEAILLGMSERGVCGSAGAACSSGSLEPSPVLLAMGVPEPVAHGSVRLSISRFTTDEEIDRALAVIPEVVRRLARTLPVGR